MIEQRDINDCPKEYKQPFLDLAHKILSTNDGFLYMTDVFHISGNKDSLKVKMDFELPSEFVLNFINKLKLPTLQ